jgi:hypothetical protein
LGKIIRIGGKGARRAKRAARSELKRHAPHHGPMNKIVNSC